MLVGELVFRGVRAGANSVERASNAAVNGIANGGWVHVRGMVHGRIDCLHDGSRRAKRAIFARIVVYVLRTEYQSTTGEGEMREAGIHHVNKGTWLIAG